MLNKHRLDLKKVWSGGGGAQSTMDSILASRPAALGSILGILFSTNRWSFLSKQSSVDLEPRDRNRRTPMDLAAKHGHEDIIKFLENEKRRRNTFLPVFLDIW